MSKEINKQKLLSFLATITCPDVQTNSIDGNADLVEAGLIDSLAILQIVTFLEQEFEFDFAASGTDPGRLRSVDSILDLVQGSKE
ncbi:phosphopantetheine-binding protein [bacterium]|nr:phosphopantetheine-binding protein [Opitutales bacterium]MDB2499791.1 phosphopantetheine-binding protein [bacterium]